MKNSAKAIFILFSLLALSGIANANVTVTAATGGGAIASNTAPGCSAAGTWAALTGPTIKENNAGEIGLGNIVLSAPAGFVFNTNAVTILLAGSGTAGNNINNVATGTSMAVTSITATAITFNVTATSTRTNTLTWQGIQVRPTASTPLATGNITETGPSTITGVIAATNFGTLTEVTSAPACNPTVLAEYRMDEASWNGTTGEVADSAGSNPGTAATLTTPLPTTANTTPAIAGSPGTCRYGVFDRTKKNYVALPASFPNLGASTGTNTSFTITAWIRTTDNTLGAQRVFIDDELGTQGYGVSLGDGGTGMLRFYTRGTPSVLILDTPNVIASNVWYFVAAVADLPNKLKRIYVYGTTGVLLANVSATWTEANFGTGDAGIASIGGETNIAVSENTNAFGFAGNIDEVRVYGNVLSQSALAAIATQTHVCPVSGPDHILVQHDGNGLTCTPETLTVIACANAACTTPNYTASAVTGVITWAGTPGGTIPFNIIANGTTTASLPVTTVQTVTLGTSAVNPAALNASTCLNTATSTASCTMTFNDSGLLVSVPNHVSETLQNITISAVRKSNNALNCVPAFANVSRAVNLKCVYSNPTTGTLPLRVAGTPLAANATSACSAGGATPMLAFDATGTATPTLQYADVGQMTLNGTYTGSAGTGDSGLSMTGSGSFIAAPASFAFSGITAPPIKAGNSFNATVTALNSLGAATPNFGKETSPESVTLSSTLVTPNPVTYPAASNPTPGNNVIAGTEFGAGGMVNDANGVATVNNLSWGEVGSITLTASLTSGSYLGSGLNATGATVGAFIPDHFDTAVVLSAGVPMPCPACAVVAWSYANAAARIAATGFVATDVGKIAQQLDNSTFWKLTATTPTWLSAISGFVYSGQPFSEQVTARNLANGTTANYHSAYGLSNNVTLTAWDALGSVITQNPGTGVLANITMASTAFSGGVGLTSTQAYTFATSPTNPTDIFLRAVDAVNTTVTSRLAIPANSVEGGVKVVSGKVKISNAHGSELLPLPLTATVQYWNTTNWVTSTTDNVTSFNTATDIAANIVKGPLASVSVVSPGGVTVAGGVKTFTLNKPLVPGSADISLSAPSYLLAGSNVAGVNPSMAGRATFGVYKGANEFIYLRENY